MTDPRAPDTLALARDVPRLLRTSGVPGLSVAVVQDGHVAWTRAFGTVGDSAGTALDTASVFEAASLSKPVFAYLVLRLADRGELDLDRPLHQLVEYPRLAHDERSERITARMVLSHSTGLPNWGGERLTLQFEPGTAYGYSGEGFVYLQKAVERLTGRPLEELARREVFEPLGMAHSSFVWQERFAGHVAYAKDWLWNFAPVTRYADASAAYTLLTTASDYARFVSAVLTGRGLTPATWKAFLTPVHETSPGIGIGLGIRVEERPTGPIFYHSGNNGRRFTCYMTGDVGRGIGLVFFASAYNGTSLVAPVASPVFGRSDPPRNWAQFDRYDDPRRLAVQSVQRAAVEGGAEAARARLRTVSGPAATRPTFDDALELGAFFTGRGLAPLAVELLERTVGGAPDSAAAHLALGAALEAAGDLPRAVASYRRAEALGADSSEARRRIQWVEDRLNARAHPATVPPAMLERYAGRYQERTVTVRSGRLYYEDGASRESALDPLGQDLFELETNPETRLQFVHEGGEPPARLLVRYRDGTVDEARRSR